MESNKNGNTITDENHTTPDAPTLPSERFYAFVERTMGKTLSAAEKIQMAYRRNDLETVRNLIDAVTDSILEDNPEYQENLAKLKGLRDLKRGSSDEAKAIIERQRNLVNQYQRLVTLEVGLPIEASQDDIEKGRTIVDSRLKEAGVSLVDDPGEAFSILGITTEVDGEIKYSFPMDLFPESVNEKWCAYIASVVNHIDIANKLGQGTASREEVVEADKTRRFAHNAVSRDVGNILRLDTVLGWDFEKARDLLIKMREDTYPTVEAAAAAIDDPAIQEGMHAVDAINHLSRRI